MSAVASPSFCMRYITIIDTPKRTNTHTHANTRARTNTHTDVGHVMYVMYAMYAIYVLCWIIVFDRPISIRGINTKNILINIMIFLPFYIQLAVTA